MEFDIFENVNINNITDNNIQEDNFEEVIDYKTTQKTFFNNSQNKELKELVNNKLYNSNEFLLKSKANSKLNKLKLLLYQKLIFILNANLRKFLCRIFKDVQESFKLTKILKKGFSKPTKDNKYFLDSLIKHEERQEKLKLITKKV